MGPSDGDNRSVNDLIVVMQAEVRELAARQMARERHDHTLQPTALISEAYLRLCSQKNLKAATRAQFLAAAAQTIRRVLIDHARERGAKKRGGDRERLTLTGADPAVRQTPVDVLDLNDALERLERQNERIYRVVVCRYFAGMTMGEIAEALGIGLRTAEEDWTFAKAWLRRELEH
jgi:RNA polymerase sigma factor (TIGR02999 family)